MPTFFDLPAELRNAIYHLTFDYPLRAWADHAGLETRLTSVNRQMRSEALSAYYANADGPLKIWLKPERAGQTFSWLDIFGAEAIPRLKTLELNFRSRVDWCYMAFGPAAVDRLEDDAVHFREEISVQRGQRVFGVWIMANERDMETERSVFAMLKAVVDSRSAGETYLTVRDLRRVIGMIYEAAGVEAVDCVCEGGHESATA